MHLVEDRPAMHEAVEGRQHRGVAALLDELEGAGAVRPLLQDGGIGDIVLRT
ncbi:MAG: hypothetical protein R3C69_03975 [Geminicoccaceae bacterium]